MMTRYLSLPRNRLLLLAGLLLGLLIGPGQRPDLVWAQESHTTAFVNVNVIPMTTEAVLENKTVLVEGDRITALGPAAEVTVPAGAEIIDGNGAYLMPGLADMHTHLAFDPDPAFLRLYLAQGVTTIRNLSGLPMHLEWRDVVDLQLLVHLIRYDPEPTLPKAALRYVESARAMLTWVMPSFKRH